MRIRLAVVSTVLLAAVWLVGCGQTGPLYLPENGEENGEAPSAPADGDSANG